MPRSDALRPWRADRRTNGVVVWFFAYLWPNMGDAVATFPSNVIVVGVIWGLVEIVLGSIAGARLYRE
jgi:hypothetical protein